MSARTPEETHAQLAAAFDAGDVDAFVAAYEPDATMIVPPEGGVARGHAEIRRAVEATFALQPTADIEVVRKLESDGLALTHARWRLHGHDPEGRAVELAGRGSIVSRRQPDGTWLIALDNPLTPA